MPEPVVTIFEIFHQRDARLSSATMLDRRRLLERRETAALIDRIDRVIMNVRIPAREVAEWITAQADRLGA